MNDDMGKIVGIHQIEIFPEKLDEYLGWSLSKKDARYKLGNTATEFLKMFGDDIFIQLTRWKSLNTLNRFLKRPLTHEYFEYRDQLRKSVSADIYKTITRWPGGKKDRFGEGLIIISYIRIKSIIQDSFSEYIQKIHSKFVETSNISVELLQSANTSPNSNLRVLIIRGNSLHEIDSFNKLLSSELSGERFFNFEILSSANYEVILGYGL